MSILDELRKKKSNSGAGLFGIITGFRTSGKSTIAGTLPGKTLMLQAAVRETGSNSAIALAAERKNHLEILSFDTVPELMAMIHDFHKHPFDNLFIDGISAITEIRFEEPEIQAITLKNQWDGYAAVKKTMHTAIFDAKKVSVDHGKHVFMTLAIDPVLNEAGAIVEMKPNLVGRATLQEIKKYGNAVMVVRSRLGDKGETIRELVTKNDGPYSARIDTLLDHENPGTMPADLSIVLKYVTGAKK